MTRALSVVFATWAGWIRSDGAHGSAPKSRTTAERKRTGRRRRMSPILSRFCGRAALRFGGKRKPEFQDPLAVAFFRQIAHTRRQEIAKGHFTGEASGGALADGKLN